MYNNIQSFLRLRQICEIFAEDHSKLADLKEMLISVDPQVIKFLQNYLIGSFFPLMKELATNNLSFSSKEKFLLVETLYELFKRVVIESTQIFFNYYSFLLFELYNAEKHQVLPCTEEYKLAVVHALTELFKCISMDNYEEIYSKESSAKFSQIIFVCGEFIKNEKNVDLRCDSMTCILALAKCLPTDDFNDIVLRDQIAEMFMFFIPGISSMFTHVAMEDITIGHRVLAEAISAYGKLLALIMQDYNKSNQRISMSDVFFKPTESNSEIKIAEPSSVDPNVARINATRRDSKWYSTTDRKLKESFQKFLRITYHCHLKVRLALVEFVGEITTNCLTTMPQSITTLIEFIIILRQDENETVSSISHNIFEEVSNHLSSNDLDVHACIENFEENFYNAINNLPLCIHSMNVDEKLCLLNLLIGYINLFGPKKLKQVLNIPDILQTFVTNLLCITELEKSNITILEEYKLKDFDLLSDFKSPWIVFCHFSDDRIKAKIELLCFELAAKNIFNELYYPLYNTFLYDTDHRKEAIFLINCLVMGINESTKPETDDIIHNLINLYTDELYNNLEYVQDVNTNGMQSSLEKIRNNIIIVCLLTEGLGKISLAIKKKFKYFLIKSLYILLERAGSSHYMVSAAGLLSLQRVTKSCQYTDINHLLKSNFGFYSFILDKKLKKPGDKEHVLGVLGVILKYCDKDILRSIYPTMAYVLMYSFEQCKARYAMSYLKLFKTFIAILRRWFCVEIRVDPIKSKAQKEKEYQEFRVSGINNNENFSDLEGKTAEELYQEDMKKKQEELKQTLDNMDSDESDGLSDKIVSPYHVTLVVKISNAVLNMLPSKNREKRLIALEILENGIDMVVEYEDDLLPLVHRIWSPLVPRFQDNDSLVIRHSVKLLKTLARVSKDFIRLKMNDVLPSIMKFLKNSAEASYLKDRGSAYRYTQEYKLQYEILQSLGRILTDIDASDEIIMDAVNTVYPYLSEKQPKPLQAGSISFFKDLITYDAKTLKSIINTWVKISDEYKINVDKINHLLS